MQACLFLAPASLDGSGRRDLFTGPRYWSRLWTQRRRWFPVVQASVTVDGQQNHYAVLGVSPDASSADIKKAYRLLALKHHPDVSKDSQANQVFNSIHLAYEILSNETMRRQYDQARQFQEEPVRPCVRNWDYSSDYEDGFRVYRWADLRQRMKRERYWEQDYAREEDSSFCSETDDVSEEDTFAEKRGSFIEVIKSVFLSLFLIQTIGIRLSLTFSSLMAFRDNKLDAGYKIGYLIAWILGGRGGILLTFCLSFASWACGKTSSSVVALAVTAMWIGSNLARNAPLPQGALITLLYMSIKLQVDLN